MTHQADKLAVKIQIGIWQALEAEGYKPNRDAVVTIRLAALQAIDLAGYAVVPVEPTSAMLEAMKQSNEGVTNVNEDWDDCHRAMHSAMIAAAEGGE